MGMHSPGAAPAIPAAASCVVEEVDAFCRMTARPASRCVLDGKHEGAGFSSGNGGPRHGRVASTNTASLRPEPPTGAGGQPSEIGSPPRSLYDADDHRLTISTLRSKLPSSATGSTSAVRRSRSGFPFFRAALTGSFRRQLRCCRARVTTAATRQIGTLRGGSNSGQCNQASRTRAPRRLLCGSRYDRRQSRRGRDLAKRDKRRHCVAGRSS